MTDIQYRQFQPEHFDEVIALGNAVHGDNYLDPLNVRDFYQRGFKDGINASWVALENEHVVGFRLTFAPGNWQIDKWCTPEEWQLPCDQVCYFKCNTVDPRMQGKGIGSEMLAHSVQSTRHQGAKAGLAHIWLASPGNSAYRYFTKCGGITIKEHPGKWRDLAINDGYDCPVCDVLCDCVAAEMLLTYS